MVTLSQIKEARERIAKAVHNTPIIQASYASLQNQPVFFKMENMQRTGAFKERGAANKLLGLSMGNQGAGEIIAASAGNHSQAVSLHGNKLGYKVSIIMPKATPLTKIAATEKWGAKVTLHGESFDEALELAKSLAKERNAMFIHAYDDVDIIAGQGTIGLEILEQLPDLDSVVIPVGGGGLASGIATVIKELKPSCKVYGIQTENCSKVYAAVKNIPYQQKPPVPTIADGIAVKSVGQITVPIMQKYLDDMVLVSEEKIAEAIFTLLEQSKTVAEGAGAAGLAALLQGKIPVTKNTLCILCGGNIDVTLISRIIEKGLLRSHRLMHLEVTVTDRPGGLNSLTELLAEKRANIWQIQHERAFADMGLYQTGTDLIIEIRGPEHEREIMDALTAHGFSFTSRNNS